MVWWPRADRLQAIGPSRGDIAESGRAVDADDQGAGTGGVIGEGAAVLKPEVGSQSVADMFIVLSIMTTPGQHTTPPGR